LFTLKYKNKTPIAKSVTSTRVLAAPVHMFQINGLIPMPSKSPIKRILALHAMKHIMLAPLKQAK
jgi:hypothetical protein